MRNLKLLPKGFFKANQARLFDLAAEHLKPLPGDVVLLSGPVTTDHFDDDALSYVFQEHLYYYLTGINADPDTYAILNLSERKVFVFCQEVDPAANYWHKIRTPNDFKKDFEIDDAFFTKELSKYLERTISKENKIYLYSGTNPYSGLKTLDPSESLAETLKNYNINKTDFYEIACEARVKKSADEISAIKQAANEAVYVHQQVMKQIAVGQSEMFVSDLFTSIRTQRGATQPYMSIVCFGENGSYLHYSPSSLKQAQSGELVLIDNGCAVNGYASDITRTYPISGKFTAKQADLYNIVLAAQNEAFSKIKPGVNWVNVHIAAEKTLLKGLVEKGLVTGDVEDLWTKRVIYYFMPHGIGHYIGLYTHDLPGLKSKENNWNPIKMMNLRVKRELEAGMVLTVEPGLYFNKVLLDTAYADPAVRAYINKDKVEEYRKEVGGIRIEDMVVVTADGFENLVVGLPKTVPEIEAFMKR